ncbi:hypothetical protein BC828DRAFT_440926 [Blastocladiella britannica]|nr:hypothetical protein BC828DRAFT_440926 [Blastocladiella britannica]
MTVHATALVVAVSLGLVLHPIGLALLAVSFATALRNWRISRNTRFWSLAVIGILFLGASSVIEILFDVTYLDYFRTIPWTPYNTLSADICVRVGFACITSLRLRRLQLIVRRPSLARLIPVTIACGVILMAATGGVTVYCRINEYAYFHDPASISLSRLTSIRNIEGITSFVCFMLTQVGNVVTDLFFYRIIMDASNASWGTKLRLTRRHLLGHYIPAILVDALFMVFMILARVLPLGTAWSISQFMMITLMRFSPTISTFVFYRYTVPECRRILRLRLPMRSSTAAAHAVPGGLTFSVDGTLASGSRPFSIESNQMLAVGLSRQQSDSSRYDEPISTDTSVTAGADVGETDVPLSTPVSASIQLSRVSSRASSLLHQQYLQQQEQQQQQQQQQPLRRTPSLPPSMRSAAKAADAVLATFSGHLQLLWRPSSAPPLPSVTHADAYHAPYENIPATATVAGGTPTLRASGSEATLFLPDDYDDSAHARLDDDTKL